MKSCTTVLACLGLVSVAGAQVTLGDAGGWLESAYAQWASDGSDSYNVYYSGNGKSNVKVDAELVRKYGSTWRKASALFGTHPSAQTVYYTVCFRKPYGFLLPFRISFIACAIKQKAPY